MRITESQLRRIVRDEILKEASLADRVTLDPIPYDVDTDIEGGGGLKYGDRPTTAWRRDIKRAWNVHADHALFDDPSRLNVIHFLGYYSYKRSLNDYFPAKTSVPGRIPGIDLPSRNELSCFGYIPPRGPRSGDGPYFTFRKYRVTFVSHADAATERLSKATKKDRARMAGSGLAKRPGSDVHPLFFYPLDDDDMPLDGRLDEVVIDNWIIDTYHGPASERKKAEALGLKFAVLK